MKFHVKKLALALLILTGSTSYAQTSIVQEDVNNAKKVFSPLITEDSSLLKLTIQFENPHAEKIDISFFSNGAEVWSYAVRSRTYSQVYDLSSLEDGTYTVMVRKGKERIARKIKLSTDTFTVRTKTLL